MLTKDTTKTFHNNLYAGKGYLHKITLLKRGDDQQQGTVRSIILFQCRRKKIHKTGEPIHGDESSSLQTVWQIPRTQLKKAGVAYINAADRIIDYDSPQKTPRYWQPESDTHITVQLFENYLNVECKSVNPPMGQ